MTTRLKPDGKPMRALRVLASDGGHMSESGVYLAGPSSAGDYFDALARLEDLHYAKVNDHRMRREQRRWKITRAGRDYLASVDR